MNEKTIRTELRAALRALELGEAYEAEVHVHNALSGLYAIEENQRFLSKAVTDEVRRALIPHECQEDVAGSTNGCPRCADEQAPAKQIKRLYRHEGRLTTRNPNATS